MDTRTPAEGGFEPAPPERFTGPAWVKYGPGPADGSTTVVVVNFAPGSRTNWHSHHEGQYIYIVEGLGRVRSRGEAGVQAAPGDIIWVPPGEWHFHGGTPETPMVHFAFNGGGNPEWGEPVTDEEYGEGF